MIGNCDISQNSTSQKSGFVVNPNLENYECINLLRITSTCSYYVIVEPNCHCVAGLHAIIICHLEHHLSNTLSNRPPNEFLTTLVQVYCSAQPCIIAISLFFADLLLLPCCVKMIFFYSSVEVPEH